MIKLRYLTDPPNVGYKCPKCGTVYWEEGEYCELNEINKSERRNKK